MQCRWSPGVLEFVNLEKVSVLNMKRGRCHQCQVTKTEHPHHTSFACGVAE